MSDASDDEEDKKQPAKKLKSTEADNEEGSNDGNDDSDSDYEPPPHHYYSDSDDDSDDDSDVPLLVGRDEDDESTVSDTDRIPDLLVGFEREHLRNDKSNMEQQSIIDKIWQRLNDDLGAKIIENNALFIPLTSSKVDAQLLKNKRTSVIY